MEVETLSDSFDKMAKETGVPLEKLRQVRCVFIAGALSALLNVTNAHATGREDEAIIAMVRECAEFNHDLKRSFFGPVQ